MCDECFQMGAQRFYVALVIVDRMSKFAHMVLNKGIVVAYEIGKCFLNAWWKHYGRL